MKVKITFLILSLATLLNAQVEKTLVKSLPIVTSTSFSEEVLVTLPGDAEVRTWDEEFIRITTYISVSNMSERIVDQLIMVGRYTLSSDINDGTGVMHITMPKMANTITVKGVELSELLRFEISVPKGFPINVKNAAQHESTVDAYKQAM